MKHLMQLIIVTLSMLFYLPVQAGFEVSMSNECAIFADEASDDSKEEGEENLEEEEPDCD